MAHITTVTRLKGVAYEVHWREADTKKMRTFRSAREAERFRVRIELDKAQGRSTEPLAGRGLSVADIVTASLAASTPKLKPGTLAGYRLLYDTRILPRFGTQRISQVTSQQVEAWVSDLVAEGLAPNTIHNNYVALNKLFRYSIRHRIVTHNPCEAVELPKNHASADFEPVFLTASQVEMIATALEAEAPFGTLIRFAAYTGLRAGEIAGLRVRDVNLIAREVQVRQTVKKIDGEWTVGTPKSARSTRVVPLLMASLVTELRKVVLMNPDSGNTDAYFWPARNGATGGLAWDRPLDTSSFRRYCLVPNAARLRIAPHMRLHDLRHTYASLMLAAGFKPYEVSRWMGHASVSTTDGIYGHLYPVDRDEQTARFERFVGLA